jgi:amino acid permease
MEVMDSVNSPVHSDGLASAGNASKIFLRTSRGGIPYVSIAFCSCFAFLAYMSLGAGSGTVFGWFANMTAVAGLMTWFGICFTYIRFYKGIVAQGLDRSKLPYASNIQPFAAWYGAIACMVICFVRDNCLSSPKNSFRPFFLVQRIDNLPRWPLEHSDFCHQLSAARALPSLIYRQ